MPFIKMSLVNRVSKSHPSENLGVYHTCLEVNPIILPCMAPAGPYVSRIFQYEAKIDFKIYFSTILNDTTSAWLASIFGTPNLSNMYSFIFSNNSMVLALKNGLTSQNSPKIEPMVRNLESRENKVVLHFNVDCAVLVIKLNQARNFKGL